MAAPSQTRNLWLTIGAAAATLVVVGGVLAGPAILHCHGSDLGFGACLRNEVVKAGLLPHPEPLPPIEDVTPAAPKTVVETPEEPELTLLRAEPDGSLIVAGTGKPGISVQVYANGVVVGEAVAEASGDWVVVPDKPLLAGSAEIRVGIAGRNEPTKQSFVVTINPDRVSEPVVVTSQPAEPEPKPEPAPQLTPSRSFVPPRIEREAPERIIEADVPAELLVPLPPPVEPVPIAKPTIEIDGEADFFAGAGIESAAVRLQVEDPPAPIVIAEAPAEKPEPAPVTPMPATPPTIDAIEIDGEANFFAGAGMEGAVVRLFVENRFVAQAHVEGGRWLVEARGALKLPKQRVRIEMLRPQSTKVSARAEVYFLMDVPEPLPPVGVNAAASGGIGPAGSAEGTAEIALDDPTIPVLRAIPSGDPAKLRFASGKAIIRRGESLWGIARRAYGDGSKYLAIFDANRDQLSSPGEISPGQVFNLPKVQE